MTEREQRWVGEARASLEQWRRENRAGGLTSRCLEAQQVSLLRIAGPDLPAPAGTALNAAAMLEGLRRTGKLVVPYLWRWTLISPALDREELWGIGWFHSCGLVRGVYAGHVALLSGGMMYDNTGVRPLSAYWRSRLFMLLQPEFPAGREREEGPEGG